MAPIESKNLPERDKWANKTEFFLSCLGYAIGIGNVWRFPYLCYRSGGGAFLIPYFLMLFTCGIPLFFMETSLGQFASTGLLTLFKISPIFKGTGYAIIIVNFIVSTYFTTIYAYPINYLLFCFQSPLPWSDCNHPWNTEKCVEIGLNKIVNQTALKLNVHSGNLVTPADEFFHKKILDISSGIDEVGSVVWTLFFCNLFAWIVTYLCLIKGVKTVGKLVYFTATFPFVILIILFVRGVTLPGAWEGIKFYIYPQWDQLTNLKVWADAALQIFFSLGPGWGGLVSMASFNDFNNNNKRDSILVPIINCGTSVFAGFVVFSVIGFMSHETGIPVATVATEGPGLAFVTYAEALSLMPLPHIWSVLFFLMLFFLGLDSQFVQIEAVIASIIDEYPVLRRHKMTVTFGVCLSMTIFSTLYVTNAGMYWLQLFDWYSASISVITICLIEIIIVGWIYGINNFVKDVEFMIQEKVHRFWVLSWRYTNPLILSFLLATAILYSGRISYNGVSYPSWAISFGWLSCASSIVCIPLYAFYRLLYYEEGDIIERIKSSLKCAKEWGPAKTEDLKNWMLHVQLKRLKSTEQDILHDQFVQLSV
ncbi:sodium- and chloride-dependent glycine transporter 1-like isoform X2 [Aethina tumida]|uniref:sodium- and chloride-dependent glycine transporter 1-like isoform X2 n=1 Tax=Aethina tumida TaxID=116153 RepID=UPI002148B397|nr:sodium- and chloride-dependent glycine transporter 1-like isoform X2 [Aethina tumida]XP_049823006.1 sodium- and chloride-dependent glycine transporter 1-like isoform X2 [Aethina tumida]